MNCALFGALRFGARGWWGGGGGVGGHGTDTEGELSFKAESDPAHSYG